MSAVAERQQQEEEVAVQRRLWTVADLVAVPSDLPSGPSCDELWDGRLRLGLVAGWSHGSACAKMGAALGLGAEQSDGGRVYSRTGIVLSYELATVLAPDISVITANQLPVRRSPEDWLLTVPALIVEVRAFMESTAELEWKVRRYLDAGASLVWLADPETRTVAAYSAGQTPRLFRKGDELTADGVLPEFRWAVESLFDGVAEPASLEEGCGPDPVPGTVVQWSDADGQLVRRRFWTVGDLAALPAQLPSGPALYELWDGELRLMSPVAEIHGNLENRLGGVLLFYGEWEGHGRSSCGEVGIVIDAEQDTVFGADAVFLSKDQLPARHCGRGFLLTVPAIVAEVRSKNDSLKEIREKARRYQEAGARLVWVADQRKQTVTAYRQGQEPEVLGVEDELTAEGIIPGLKFPIRRIFEGLDD